MPQIPNTVKKIHPKYLLSGGSITGYIISESNIKEEIIPFLNEEHHVDSDLYNNFQLYLKNYANPIRIDISEKKTITYNVCPECGENLDESIKHFEGKLITSEKYRDSRQTETIRALASAIPRSDNTILYLLIGSMVMNLVFGLAIGVF